MSCGKWHLDGWDEFDSTFYRADIWFNGGAGFDTREEAEGAALELVRQNELIYAPDEDEDEQNSLRDEVYIVTPEGDRQLFTTPS